MRRTWVFLLCFAPLPGLAQEGGQFDAKALRASENLTREANEELAENDFVDAEANFRRAISKSVENPVAPYNLGNAYYAKESYGEAFGRFKEAGERAGVKPQKHQAYHNMGNVYMKQKDYQKAVEAYKEALRNNPADEETRYNLALAQKLLKDQQQNQNNENKDQNQDQNQDQGDNKEKDKEQDQGDDNEDKNKENNQGDEEKKNQQPQPNQLSDQQIQQLLEAMNNEENKTQQKVNAKKARGKKVNQEKDW